MSLLISVVILPYVNSIRACDMCLEATWVRGFEVVDCFRALQRTKNCSESGRELNHTRVATAPHEWPMTRANSDQMQELIREHVEVRDELSVETGGLFSAVGFNAALRNGLTSQVSLSQRERP